AELYIMTLNYRDEKNNPQHENPVVLSLPENIDLEGKRVLLVDDVSVSGKTLDAALALLQDCEAATFTMKGKADYVLFPEIKECVKWPWK
ncbi:MAG: phosphoribosyltransferase, partial [Prolixibacteraceae bacterium]|nr:phosphoribosyltransferase [Prolixibacteraceae bacterium]